MFSDLKELRVKGPAIFFNLRRTYRFLGFEFLQVKIKLVLAPRSNRAAKYWFPLWASLTALHPLASSFLVETEGVERWASCFQL
jgi:hypothetical protein